MSIKNLLSLKDKEGLHHAYLVTGEVKENLRVLREDIEKILGHSVDGYPDYYSRTGASFTVGDSRELIARQKTKSFACQPTRQGGGMRFFVIGAESFTTEAQNGLLKVLEEPIAGNHFFILTPNEEILLPTLRSRLARIRGCEVINDEILSWCQSFIGADVVSRLVMIEKFLKDSDKDDNEKLIRHKTRDILNQIEKIFAEKIKVSDTFIQEAPAIARFLTELLKMKGYLNDTAPAPRLILEYIAFVCP